MASIIGTALADLLEGTAQGDGISGLGGDDTLVGLAGDDTLNGGAGADTMQGGLGNDVYFVDAPGDRVVELAGQGTDRIHSSLSYSLVGLPDVEDLVLTGTANLDGTGNDAANALTGNAGRNRLVGGGGDDTLVGAAGADTLNGGAGADAMQGGLGNDVYFVDAPGDAVVELAGQGTDRVHSSLSYSLVGLLDVENLTLTGTAGLAGTGNGLANVLTGNAGANVLAGGGAEDTLRGGAGADMLDGGPGADVLEGGLGNDVYLVDDPGDVVTELPDQGADGVRSAIGYSLAALPEVEDVALTGTADLDATGNDLPNLLNGNAGANLLAGGEGNDTLLGGPGADRLQGDAGDDVLRHDPLDVLAAGGTGTDTLQVPRGAQTLDLTAGPAGSFTGLEVIDLGASADNTVVLDASAVLASSDGGELRVDGAPGDVILAGAGWLFQGAELAGGQSYARYVQGGATLRLDSETSRTGVGFEVDLAAPGAAGLRVYGAGAGDYSGFAVAGAGDVNGDGFADLLIGAPYADGPGNARGLAGESYLVFGSGAGLADLDLASLAPGAGLRLYGAGAGDYSGLAVAGAGDVNGDGLADLLIGAPYADGPGNARSLAGESYLVFGKSSGLADLDLASLAPAAGFRIFGAEAGDYAGLAVAAAGDVNGDGCDDLLVGADGADGQGNARGLAGETYLVFGRSSGFTDVDLASLAPDAGTRLSGADAGDRSGHSVAAAGDVNGDGFDDLLIGAYFADGPGNARFFAGESYVVFGRATGLADLDLATLAPGAGFRIHGADAGDGSGVCVAAAGDVNGDGLADLIVGADSAAGPGNARPLAGESYVVFGRAAGLADIDLASLAPGSGFRIFGAQAGDGSGLCVAAAGDVNGDGLDDLLVGAAGADGPGNARDGAGESYVIFGKATGLADIDLASLAPGAGFRIDGAGSGDGAGASLAAAGDVNGDGFDDLVIGAPYGDGPGNGRGDAGETAVIFGFDFLGQVNRPGTAGNDSLIGTAAADLLVGGLGDDTLDGAAGADVLRGGAGDDRLVWDPAERRVDGGAGTDTLQVSGAGVSIDLTAISNLRITGIERTDLTGAGNNSLTLALGDLLDLSDTTNTLLVGGDAGDSVTSSGQGWTPDAGGPVAVGGVLYDGYTLGAAHLLVETDLTRFIT